MTKSLTVDQGQVLGAYRRMLAERGMTVEEGAREICCSVSALKELLDGEPRGRVGGYCQAMHRAITRYEASKKALPAPPFVLTSVAEQIFCALHQTWVDRCMTCILGPSGIGKSEALREWCRQEKDPVLITVGHGSTAKSILTDLMEAFWSYGPDSYHCYEKREVLARHLRGVNRLILFDDCDFLAEDALQSLRMIWDLAEIGMVFTGTPAFFERLRQKKSATIDQFLARFAYYLQLQPCTAADIEKLTEGYPMSAGAKAVLVELSAGSARRAIFALKAARRIANGEIGEKHMAAAFKLLITPV